MKSFLSTIFLFVVSLVFSQKKAIDHTVYNDWKKLEAQMISNDGNFVSYTIKPHRGDGYLYIYNQKTAKLDSIPRGYKQQFSGNSKFLVFKITPGFDTLRNCELNKLDKEKWPKDSLGIYYLDSDSLIKIPNLKSYSLPESGDWVSYSLEINSFSPLIEKVKTKEKEIEKKRKWCIFKKKPVAECEIKEEKEEYKSDGKIFIAFNPIKNKKFQYKDVTEFFLSEKGNFVAITLHKKEKKISTYQLAILDLQKGDYSVELSKKTEFNGITFNHSETAMAIFCSEDTTKNKQFELQSFDLIAKKWITIIDTNTSNIPVSKSISDKRFPIFSEDDKQLFFGISDKVKQDEKDSLLASEKANLDLWHYRDKRLQPQQLIELKNDKKKTDLYVYQFSDKKIIQLSNDTLNVNLSDKHQGDYLFASSIESYQETYNWTSPNLEDHYRIFIKDGMVELIKKGVGFGGKLSPSGKLYTYYNGEERNHYLINLETKKEVCLTCERKDIKWDVDLNGQPQVADPQGIIGWLKDENEVMIQSEYDIWNFSISSGNLISVTNEEGKRSKTKLSTSLWDNDSLYIDYNNLSILGLDDSTKSRSIFELIDNKSKFEFKKIYSTDHDIVSLDRSKNEKTIIFRKASVKDYPDLFIIDKNFTSEKQISTTNPQQKDYNWSTVEMVNWTSYDGIPLQGLVYKPENYDMEKEYPLMVYFYELYSDEIHNHYAPKPTASVIHPTEYVSAGYIVFIPDIRYREGHPAKSAYDCIMSGTDKVLKLYPNIDSKRMGLQGQSWGGYQTAQLITMTARYAAAMAGAPVSNMFSAYGGIRWGSGLNRQFQYERQQSRIGKTIWEAPELYIENSPIFHLPKVKTPLLIMANDQDGAVPWYQGIELFTGMKRLGKPCWMLNYNGDDHNLMKNANRIDLSIRMRQFFDYYLMGTPAPKWLLDGIPAVVKGEELRLELIRE